MKKGQRLTKTQRELLADLYEVEEAFGEGKLKGGTHRSHVMFRMADRRGRTRPAPVHGKKQSDSAFAGVFTRTVNGLVSRKMVRKRSIKDDFAGLPYQWGFANHAKKDKDIFLTDTGKEMAAELVREREMEATKAAAAKATPGRKSPSPGTSTGPSVQAGPVKVQYVPAPTGSKGSVPRVTARHTVDMGGFTVTYFYTKKNRQS